MSFQIVGKTYEKNLSREYEYYENQIVFII